MLFCCAFEFPTCWIDVFRLQGVAHLFSRGLLRFTFFQVLAFRTKGAKPFDFSPLRPHVVHAGCVKSPHTGRYCLKGV